MKICSAVGCAQEALMGCCWRAHGIRPLPEELKGAYLSHLEQGQTGARSLDDRPQQARQPIIHRLCVDVHVLGHPSSHVVIRKEKGETKAATISMALRNSDPMRNIGSTITVEYLSNTFTFT